MGMEYFCCYHSYLNKLSRLSDQEVGRLFRALMQFSATGAAPELAGRESLAFDFIADDINRAKETYAERCRTNAVNASERKRSQTNAANASETSQNKDKYKNKDNTLTNVREARAQSKPTLNEIIAYCKERRSTVNPQRFFEYYEARDWKEIEDWQAALRSWENNGIDGSAQTTPASYDIERAEQKARMSVPDLKKRR